MIRHIVDAQSFPLEVSDYPFLANGSYLPSMRYSAQDVSDIVSYAQGTSTPLFPTPSLEYLILR